MTRITASGDFLPEVDGLRFLAIASVVTLHLVGTYLVITGRMGTPAVPNWFDAARHYPLIGLIARGNFGVQLFFVISGFILALPFARQHLGLGKGPSLKGYYFRRLTRLEPPYFINLLAIYWLAFHFAPAVFPHFAATAFYNHTLLFGEISTFSDVTWSLEVEVQFYLLAPLLAVVFAIPNTVLRRSVLTVGMLASGVSAHIVLPLFSLYTPFISLTLLGQVQFFLTGFLLADLHLEWSRTEQRRSVIWDLAVLAGLLAGTAVVMQLPMHQALALLPAPIFLLFLGVLRGRIARYCLTRGPIVILGGMCYTIYLYHNLIIGISASRLLARFGPGKWSCIAQVAFLLFAVAAVSCVLFACFERPFMRRDWPQRTVGFFAGIWGRLRRGGRSLAPENVASVAHGASESAASADFNDETKRHQAA